MAISVPRYDHICDMCHDLAFIGQFYIDWRNGYLYQLGGNGDIDPLARLVQQRIKHPPAELQLSCLEDGIPPKG